MLDVFHAVFVVSLAKVVEHHQLLDIFIQHTLANYQVVSCRLCN